MKKLTTLFCAMLLTGTFASAAHWWARSFVTLTSNNSLYNYGILTDRTWTVDGDWMDNTAFTNYNFDTVSSLVLNGGYGHGGYNGSDYLDESSFVLYYRAYSTTGTPGTWSSIPLTNLYFTKGSVDVIYNNVSADVDILALVGNASGSYYLEVILTKTNYWNALKTPNFTTANSGTSSFTLNTSSTGYKAMFNISIASDVHQLADSEINITSRSGVINAIFSGEKDVELYTFNGQLIRSAKVVNQFTQAVNSGVYIIKINGIAHKVLVH